MPCTTILVGRNASNDHSTMIGRTDDGRFDVKKIVVIDPKKQPRKYKSVISHVEIDLPDNPMRYTCSPSVDKTRGIWAATGINAANVGMTATETTTSNPRVLAADPLVVYKKAESKKEKDVAGGIGEEDIVVLVLPYIHSAREGVQRLGALLKQYGTYETNGIAFNDEKEAWWLETIGGHHWVARRVQDDEVVVAPNQFALDQFDFDDAFGAQKNYMCSEDLREFIKENNLDTNKNGENNLRRIFGSHSDHDRIYNTPRAWYMGRCLCPESIKWEGENAQYTPASDNIPYAFIPDYKLAVEDVKYILSAHYQGTDYDPYISRDTGKRGMYRSIGINRTGVTSICQIRAGLPEEIKAIEWVIFGSTTFSAALPVYTNVDSLPKYLTDVTLDVSTENFYWNSRLIGSLADPIFSSTSQLLNRYHNTIANKSREIINKYDKKMIETKDYALMAKANEEICQMAKKATTDIVNQLVLVTSQHMKNGYNLADF